MKRALVISGGGALGAFAGGLTKKLYDNGIRWNSHYGTSTGALLNTLIAVEDFDELKHIYTNVSNKDIFNKPPFSQKGRLNIFRVFYRLLSGKTSIGEAKNLHKLIKRTFTEEDFAKTIKNDKILCACVTNYTLGGVKYAYNYEEAYEDFVNYVYASASVPVAMNLVEIEGFQYLDGGVMEHVPLQQAINDGADEVDVIVLRPDYSEMLNPYEYMWKPKNSIDVILRTLELMLREISLADIIIGKLKAKNKTVKINIFYTPYRLSGNSLVFDNELMNKWWDMGYDTELNFETTKVRVPGKTIREKWVSVKTNQNVTSVSLASVRK